MSITGIVRKVFESRQRELEKHQNGGEALQRAVLSRLVDEAQDTEYGRNHVFSAIKGYEEFVKNNPINTYEEMKGFIDRMRHGEADILWPGRVKWYARSSGTTNDKSIKWKDPPDWRCSSGNTCHGTLQCPREV